jgi:transcription initiation factor IIE alpha subunit
MATTQDAVRDLPPSAKLVYKALKYEGPMTQSQLVTETMLPARTVRDALSRLADAEIVEERIFVPDARKSTYAVAEERTASRA